MPGRYWPLIQAHYGRLAPRLRQHRFTTLITPDPLAREGTPRDYLNGTRVPGVSSSLVPASTSRHRSRAGSRGRRNLRCMPWSASRCSLVRRKRTLAPASVHHLGGRHRRRHDTRRRLGRQGWHLREGVTTIAECWRPKGASASGWWSAARASRRNCPPTAPLRRGGTAAASPSRPPPAMRSR